MKEKIAEQWLNLFIVNSPLAVIEWDLEWRVTQWNAEAERIFGWTASEAIGQHAYFILPEYIKSQIDLEIIQQLPKQIGGLRSTNRNLRKDGTIIECDWYNQPIVDEKGEVIFIASMVKDITEEIDMKQRIEALLDSIPGLASYVSFDLKYKSVNRKLASYFGLTPEAFVNKPIDFLDSGADLKRNIEKFIQSPLDENTWEITTNIQGQILHFLISGKKYAQGIVSVGIDITDRKRLENQLKLSEERNLVFLKMIPDMIRQMGGDRYTEMESIISRFTQIPTVSSKTESLIKLEAQTYELAARIENIEDIVIHGNIDSALAPRLRALEVKQNHDENKWLNQEKAIELIEENLHIFTSASKIIKSTPGGVKTWGVMLGIVFCLSIAVVDISIRAIGLKTYLKNAIENIQLE